MRRGLGHEHQVEVRGVGGVQEDLSQHDALWVHRRSAAGKQTNKQSNKQIIQLTDISIVQTRHLVFD